METPGTATARKHWWNEKHRKTQKRAGLEPDDFVAAAIFEATSRKLEVMPMGKEPATLLIASLDHKGWVDLTDQQQHEVHRAIYAPNYKPPLGFSVFPIAEPWRGMASFQELTIPEPGDFQGIFALRQQLAEYIAHGWRVAAVNSTTVKAMCCAAEAIRNLEAIPRQSDWQINSDAPVPIADLPKWLEAQALNEGEAEREITVRVTVKAAGKVEERGTLMPVHKFNSWEIFPELEEFDRTRRPGKLISAIRL